MPYKARDTWRVTKGYSSPGPPFGHQPMVDVSEQPMDVSEAAPAAEPELRFDVGAKVRCRVSAGWRPGVVVALHYREPSWPAGRTAPYQVQMCADGPLIYAPADDDRFIRARDEEDEGGEDAAWPSEILVCQAGACRRAGSEAVLQEIEELATGLPCSVQSSGCLGACNQAPNVVIVSKGGNENLHTRLDDLERSAAVVHVATGKAPRLDDPARRTRLQNARRLRVRQQARGEGKWNVAMCGMAEQVEQADEEDKLELRFDMAKLCHSAGQWEQALEILGEVQAVVGEDHPAVMLERGKVLTKLGRVKELRALLKRAENMDRPRRVCGPDVVSELNGAMSAAAKAAAAPDEPRRLDGYALWSIGSVTPVSRHSAVWHLTSSDPKRGTPYTRGRGRTMWHRTWHTTLLAEIGPNAEGPLPWIERDYTPVSTWVDWEAGTCDILIKVYRTGLATSWLLRQPLGTRLWLSPPRKTLTVPSLVTDTSRFSNAVLAHQSVLLVLAGSGIVAAPQVLHHTDPASCFGTATRKIPPLTSPVSVVFACRRDDVLMASELASWCVAESGARLHRCVLAVSPAGDATGDGLPFPDGPDASEQLDKLRTYTNASVVEARVTRELLEAELAPLRARGRVRAVVSGPASFNGAAREMLMSSGLEAEAITILEA